MSDFVLVYSGNAYQAISRLDFERNTMNKVVSRQTYLKIIAHVGMLQNGMKLSNISVEEFSEKIYDDKVNILKYESNLHVDKEFNFMVECIDHCDPDANYTMIILNRILSTSKTPKSSKPLHISSVPFYLSCSADDRSPSNFMMAIRITNELIKKFDSLFHELYLDLVSLPRGRSSSASSKLENLMTFDIGYLPSGGWVDEEMMAVEDPTVATNSGLSTTSGSGKLISNDNDISEDEA